METESHLKTLPIDQLLPGATTQLEIEVGDPGPFASGEVIRTATLDVPGEAHIDEATATTKLVDLAETASRPAGQR